MSAYITPEEYADLTGNPIDAQTPHLIARVSDQIDTLTFQRIKRIGFASLFPLQREIVKAVCAAQAAFLAAYDDALDSPLSSYGIGNVSMSWDASKIVQVSGVTMQRELYARLLQTGLCNRELR